MKKKNIVVLGLSAFLACGSLFAMNYPSNWNEPKTESSENAEEEVCDECWEKEDGKDALGHTQIQITNNCSYDVTVSYEYWTDHWVPVKFDVSAGIVSSWWPANSYQKFDCRKKE